MDQVDVMAGFSTLELYIEPTCTGINYFIVSTIDMMVIWYANDNGTSVVNNDGITVTLNLTGLIVPGKNLCFQAFDMFGFMMDKYCAINTTYLRVENITNAVTYLQNNPE